MATIVEVEGYRIETVAGSERALHYDGEACVRIVRKSDEAFLEFRGDCGAYEALWTHVHGTPEEMQDLVREWIAFHEGCAKSHEAEMEALADAGRLADVTPYWLPTRGGPRSAIRSRATRKGAARRAK